MKSTLFKIEGDIMLPYEGSPWSPKELDVEKYIASNKNNESILNDTIFGEELFFVKRQVITSNKKRADIVALDKAGNVIIIELKKETGRLGVETQALHYLSQFSKLKGKKFIDAFKKDYEKNTGESLEDNILGFLGEDCQVEDLNKNIRIILMARDFDSSVFSIGEWLSSQGISFRCMTYLPFEIGKERFISFSVAFDQSLDMLYPLKFSSKTRNPGFFWHNIAGNPTSQEWWDILLKKGKIAAGFEGKPGDRGEAILTSYIKGDVIFAYASKYGALGYGIIKKPDSYNLTTPNQDDIDLSKWNPHRLDIEWISTAKKLKEAVPPSVVRENFNIYHPVGTYASINPSRAKDFKKELDKRFGHFPENMELKTAS